MRKSIIFFLLAFLVLPLGVYAQGELKLQDNAPDRYVVVQGDTLWGIASKFLKDPWRWSDLWRLNQEQIKDPHRIYPGNVIVLDRSKNPPQLSREQGDPTETVKLSPTVRTDVVTTAAIPAIPPKVIEPFLSRPIVIESGGLDAAPRIVSTESGTVYVGAGGTAYVSGMGESKESNWELYRQGQALLDPDTGKILGYEAVFLGSARVVRPGEPATIRVVTSTQEISAGDRLLPTGPTVVNQYAPHAPKSTISGRVIGVLGGVSGREGGRNSVVSINKGTSHGLEMGHVLALVRTGRAIPDPKFDVSRDVAPQIRLPDERYGLAFVFRTFANVSYALIMGSTGAVSPGDFLETP